MADRDAWADLINGLGILQTGRTSNVSPTWCDHDKLWVMADPDKFTTDQIEQLDRMGFVADHAEGGFYSFRFGSA